MTTKRKYQPATSKFKDIHQLVDWIVSGGFVYLRTNMRHPVGPGFTENWSLFYLRRVVVDGCYPAVPVKGAK